MSTSSKGKNIMSTSSETALELKPGSRGRKSADGGEETISFQPIKEGVAEVMKLYKKAELAVADFNAAAKSVAEKGNINTASLKKLIKSSAKGKFKDTQRAIDQQSVLFETVGEVSGGSDMDVN